MGLLAALDDSESAVGSLFWDDGDTLGWTFYPSDEVTSLTKVVR